MRPVTTFYLLTACTLVLIRGYLQGQATSLEEASPTSGRIAVAEKIAVPYPKNWGPSALRYPNAHELMTPPPTKHKGRVIVRARILITTEQRRDHQEALRRLSEIAASV